MSVNPTTPTASGRGNKVSRRFARGRIIRATAAVCVPAFAAAFTGAAGCSGSGTIAERARYPQALAQERTLNIQVFRQERTLTMTNTSAEAFGPSRLWLNAWFSRDIDGFAVGETIELPLTDFRDRYGNAFRPGGFFATEKPDVLAQAQLETNATLVGLVVVTLPE